MRKGSVAMVPLLFAIMLLFWFIWLLGGENDNLHKVNQLENLQRTQERLIIAACQKEQELQMSDANLTEAQIKEKVNQYIHNIMVLNKIDEQ